MFSNMLQLLLLLVLLYSPSMESLMAYLVIAIVVIGMRLFGFVLVDRNVSVLLVR